MSQNQLLSQILSTNVSKVKDITKDIDKNLKNKSRNFDHERFVKLMMNEKFKLQILRNAIDSFSSRNPSGDQSQTTFIYKKFIPRLKQLFVFLWYPNGTYDYYLLPNEYENLEY